MKRILLTGTLILIVFVAGLLIWGVFVEPYWLDVQTHEASIPHLPEQWEGERVAAIADLQVGMWWHNIETIRESVSRIVRERPAVVLVAGDFVYAPDGDVTEELKIVAELLRPLTDAGLPTYAVLGNHDYNQPPDGGQKDAKRSEQVSAALQSIGVAVLRNEAVRLQSPNKSPNALEPPPENAFYLVGIGPHQPQEDKPELAMANLPKAAARFVMHHNPKTFKALPPASAPVAVAGHTHGGQIRVPFFPDWSWLKYARDLPADGWIENYGNAGNRLYVNRGIGFSIVPVRLNCRPELTFFVLRRGADVK